MAPAVQQSIGISYLPGPQQQTRSTLMQRVNGWTDIFPFTDPAPYGRVFPRKKSQLHKIAPLPFQHLFPFISHSLCLLPFPLLSPKSSQEAWGALLAPPQTNVQLELHKVELGCTFYVELHIRTNRAMSAVPTTHSSITSDTFNTLD